MNMCLLEEAMCEKYRNSHLLLEGVELKIWGLVGCQKTLGLEGGGITDLAGLLLLGRVSYPLHAMNAKMNWCGKVIFSFLEDLKTKHFYKHLEAEI